MIVRALLLAWCFARPTPLSCDMQFPPTRKCDAVAAVTEEELDGMADRPLGGLNGDQPQ